MFDNLYLDDLDKNIKNNINNNKDNNHEEQPEDIINLRNYENIFIYFKKSGKKFC